MAVDTTIQRDGGDDSMGIQRPRLPVYEFYSGSGNHTETFPIIMRDLFFSNDSNAQISVQIIGPANLNQTFILYGLETLDERVPEFTSIVITADAASAWRFYPRSGEVT